MEERKQDEAAALVGQLNDSLALNRELSERVADLRIRVADAERLQQEYVEMCNSMAYRVGRLIVEAFTRPGRRTLLLPFRLAKVVLERLIVPKLS